MSTSISQQEQDLKAQIAAANEKISILEGKLRALDDLLGSVSSHRDQYRLLEEICMPMEKLSGTGGADFFREVAGYDLEQQLHGIRKAVAEFKQKISSVEQSRNVLQTDIRDTQSSIRLLEDQLAQRQKKAARINNAQKLDIQLHDMPYRVLPWSVHGEDERRFRLILFIVVLCAVVFSGTVPFFRQPVEENKGVVVPERIARIIKKKQEAKKEEQKQLEAKKIQEAAEKAAEKMAGKSTEKKAEKAPEKLAEATPVKPVETTPPAVAPKLAETAAQSVRKSVETKGVLAFKNDLANLLNDTSSPKMGAEAKISVSAKRATGDILQRSIIVSQATGGSGGINTAAISRQGDGGGSQRIVETEKKFTHVESPASVASSGADRPLSKGAASRTDEEIQIVFDQYKSALYRIYNRELRINPTLRGKMVLLIVIEPDGHVSSCTVKSTDMASPALSADIVARVLKFEFGPKQGVPAITILYPIDFLPTN